MLTFRNAQLEDVDFIARAIIFAEKGGSSLLGYSAVFNLEEDEVFRIIRLALLEDLPHNEFWLSAYVIAEIKSQAVGTCCAWIEEAGEISSSLLKASLMLYVMGNRLIESSQSSALLLNQVHIARTPAAIQLEGIYVIPEYRGLGICGKMIEHYISDKMLTNPDTKTVQVQLPGNNLSAITAFRKSGFEVKKTMKCNDKKIFDFYPSDSKIMMELNINIDKHLK